MNARPMASDPLEATMRELGARARAAQPLLARAPSAGKVKALNESARAIRAAREEILAANRIDLAAAERAGNTKAFLDRVALDGQRIEAIAAGLAEVARLPDPVGAVSETWTRPNGLRFARVRVPIGVIAIVYEARPNVTADAGALALLSGNAAILRGGSESFLSSQALARCLRAGLAAASLPEDTVQLVPTQDRAAVGHMLTMAEFIDVIVPRGGKSLIERVMREARMPVIAHLEGLCHTYVHEAADIAMARRIVVNAKMRRTGVCGATETLLVDRAIAPTHLKPILDDLIAAGCEIRGDETTCRVESRAKPASEADWLTEYLDAILSVRVVDGLDQAIEHVNHHGSRHTDAIVTDDEAAARRFLAEIDSAIVLHNASTQFADGGEFGFGAEIGISTGRLPPRGPVGAEQLTTYKYVVHGTGQTRP
jgi:glutamate-5-semialdehyde dehydrogenase